MCAQGDPNASIPTIQPVISRPMFGPLVPYNNCITFVSAASISNGTTKRLGLRKRVEAVKGCRSVSKKDMKFNDSMPKMKVDPERYVVEADGVKVGEGPSETLPLSQAYFAF